MDVPVKAGAKPRLQTGFDCLSIDGVLSQYHSRRRGLCHALKISGT